MQVSYTTADGRMTAVFEGKDHQSIWEQIADFQEVFEDRNIKIGDKEVDTKDIVFRVRRVDGNDFYEKVYVGTDYNLRGYKMAYQQAKERKGTMYPVRKDKEGGWIENNGWTKWQGNKENAQTAPAKNTGKKNGNGDEVPF